MRRWSGRWWMAGLLWSLAMVGCSDEVDDEPMPGDACKAEAAPSGGYSYGMPLDPHAPWPKFRRTPHQDGRLGLRCGGGLAAPWVFKTGKGVFSTPVIDGDGTVYVGSADRFFYAIDATGTEIWRAVMDEIVDSSALLDDEGRVIVGAGDGVLRAMDRKTGLDLWTFEADPPSFTGGLIRWFEGNVAMLPDGNLLVPNDNFRLYAVDRKTGKELWHLSLFDQTWSSPAVDVATGNAFVGNNNLLPAGDNVFAFTKSGGHVWSKKVPGSVAASPLLTAEGLVVAGGFDGFIHAWSATDGAEAWSVATRDHVYASAAALSDGTVVVPSGDGSIYALDPKTGARRWTFDALEPIRSSPAVDGADRVYVGSGEGKLFVLNKDGTLRWSMQLIEGDRNDINASPALGHQAIVVAGESGEVFAIPYDWCLRKAAAGDTRCRKGEGAKGGGEDLPSDGALLLPTTRFGSPLTTAPSTIGVDDSLVFSLFVREAGDTVAAVLDTSTVKVTVEPQTPVAVHVSADRRFVVLVPDQPWAVGGDGKLNVQVTADWLRDPPRKGLATLPGGSKGGSASANLSLGLAAAGPANLPLPAPATLTADAAVWELSRLAAPLPTILPSYNQIGFDSLHFLVGLVEGADKLATTGALGWMIGARIEASGAVVPDPETRALVPLRVLYRNGSLVLESKDGMALEVMNANLAFSRFRVAAPLEFAGDASEPATVDAIATCSAIELYGPFLQQLGFCNPDSDALVAHGAVLLRRWEGANGGKGAMTAFDGVGSATFTRKGAVLGVRLDGSELNVNQHRLALLAVDADTGNPLALAYGDGTVVKSGGGIITVELKVPGVTLPAKVRLILMVDTVGVVAGIVG